MNKNPRDNTTQTPIADTVGAAPEDGVLSVADSLDGLVRNPTLELPGTGSALETKQTYLDEHVVASSNSGAENLGRVKFSNGEYVLDSRDAFGRILAHDQNNKAVMVVNAPTIGELSTTVYPHPILPEILDSGTDESGAMVAVFALQTGTSFFDVLSQSATSVVARATVLNAISDLARFNRYVVARGFALVGLEPKDVLLEPTRFIRPPVLRKVGDTPPAEAPRYGAPERAAGAAVSGEEGAFVLGGLLYHALSGYALTEGEVPQTFPNIPGAPQVLSLLMAAAGNRASPGETLDLLLAIQQHTTPRRTWVVGASSSVGTNPERVLNEDAFSFQVQEFSGNAQNLIACVADGMGGMAAGEVASKAAVQAFVLHPAQEILPNSIRVRILSANTALVSALSGKNGGCTFTGLMAEDNRVVIGHVGDTRAYHLQQASAKQITADHSIVAMLVKMGVIDEEASHNHPDANKVTRALGGSKELLSEQIDTFDLQLNSGERIVLMSDGVWGALSPVQLNSILVDHTSPQAMSEALVKSALDAGSADNVTALVAHYEELKQ